MIRRRSARTVEEEQSAETGSGHDAVRVSVRGQHDSGTLHGISAPSESAGAGSSNRIQAQGHHSGSRVDPDHVYSMKGAAGALVADVDGLRGIAFNSHARAGADVHQVTWPAL
jgi:hypothetical protein